METKNTTKRSLIASAFSLFACLSMFVGSTYAWFSDSVTTSVSKIQAGTLKIDLVTADGTSVVGQTLSFVKAEGAKENEEVLWEPGCTYYLPDLYVKNSGNLAFKYKVAITGITGSTKLNEVIDWTIDYGYEDGKSEGYMLGTDTLSAPIKISGHMDINAGNEYQGLSIDSTAITVVATQYAAEYDSYDNTYDENADGTPDHGEYLNVNNGDELADALKNAEANDVIVLNSGTYEITESVKTDSSFIVEADADVTLNLNGESITTNLTDNGNEPTVVNKGNLTIEGGNISNKNAIAGNTNVAAISNVSGTLTLKDCVLENVSPTTGGDYCVTVEGGKVILENCTVKGNRGGIAVSGEGSIEMIGGSVSANVYYPLYIRGTGVSTFEDVEFTKLNNSKGKAITYNAGQAEIAFTNCSFVSKTSAEIPFDISKNIGGFTFSNCTFTNVTDPTVVS